METYLSNPFLRFYAPSLDSPISAAASLRPTPALEAEQFKLLQQRLGYSELSLQELKKVLHDEGSNTEEEVEREEEEEEEEENQWSIESPVEEPPDQKEREKREDNIQLKKQEIHPIIWTGGIHRGEDTTKELEGEKEDQSVFGLDFTDLNKFSSSPYAEEILAFLNPFLENLQEEGLMMVAGECRTIIDHVIERLKAYAEKNLELTNKLKEVMKVKQLSVPYIVSDLPAEVILEFNELEEDDPLVISYKFNPVIGNKIRELGVLLDRYDTSKDVLCLLVWSTFDNSLVCLPSVGLIPYPLCWHCKESFGMQTCEKCGVAKYCSRGCQQANWKSSHKPVCTEMSRFAQQHKLLYI